MGPGPRGRPPVLAGPATIHDRRSPRRRSGKAQGTPSTGRAMALEVRAKLAASTAGPRTPSLPSTNWPMRTNGYLITPPRPSAIGSSVGTSYLEVLFVHRSAVYVYAFLADTEEGLARDRSGYCHLPVQPRGPPTPDSGARSRSPRGRPDHALQDALRIAEGVKQLTP